MDKIFVRNFFFFMIVLVACTGTMAYSLINSDKMLNQTDELVLHTHDVIIEAEKLVSLIEGMLSSQRGYLLTMDKKFLDDYESKKSEAADHIANLSELTQDNLSQQGRLSELRQYVTEFSQQLENRVISVNESGNNEIIKNVEVVNNLRNNIIRVNMALLQEEYGLLNQRFKLLEEKKKQYFSSLLIGLIAGTILVLIINAFLLNAQRKRSRAEISLKSTEERFALAVEGTDDGIFDWDIIGGKIFYSGRFFEMLGYDRQSYVGSIEDSKSLIHPDDADRVWSYAQQYLSGNLSEYNHEFRMKHQSGRWVWIQSRAKALFDKNGKAYRMVGAHTDVTHKVMLQERLESEKQQAMNANQAKSDFLAHMSHEIRTPLTAISGVAEIFDRMKSQMEDKQKKLIDVLLTSTLTLKDLVNDVLDFSKIESGEVDLNEHDFYLADVFDSVISMMSLKASEKGVSFVFDYNAVKDVNFNGDAKRIRQILINLVNNAIKFTDRGGAVRVTAISEEMDGTAFLRIDVTDTGIGISSDNFDLIFERFKQADSSVSRKYGGTGLGLTISRNLARLMRGDIFVSSETGKGSTFTILLPIKQKHSGLSQEQAAYGINNKIGEKIRSSLAGEAKILVVEDYEGNIVVIGYLLDDMGISHNVARTGVEALDLWGKHHYDLILMDIQMPEMDGFAATREIRRLEGEKNLDHTPIIGMTAHALVGDKDKCIEAGMDTYLSKPIVEAELKEQIYKYLKKKSAAA